jgi:hypothetical protein
MDFPGERVTTVLTEVPEGFLVGTSESAHFVGKKWWRYDFKDESRHELASSMPWFYNNYFFVFGQKSVQPPPRTRDTLEIRFAGPSQRYGVLASGHGTYKHKFFWIDPEVKVGGE